MKDSKSTLNIGICGFGTVGKGTYEVLKENLDSIERRVGCSIRVTRIATRRPETVQVEGSITVDNDLSALTQDANVGVVVELMGGIDAAKEVVLAAIKQGKHVVTANKALIAEHGEQLFNEAKAAGVHILFEAAVAGGIPIIKSIREGLAANEFDWLAGIINGTGNFILTEMAEKGRDFADVLEEAQALGYAEADPTFDVEGIDAAHKLTILASCAYGISLQFKHCYTEGISTITPEDIGYAHELGYRIKHLGISRNTKDGIDLRVHPTLVPKESMIAKVDGVMNAVLTKGNAVGQTMYYGAGAGAKPTASAVVADLMDLARGLGDEPALGFSSVSAQQVLDIQDIESAYYLRIEALDKAGVLAKISSTLSELGINIEAIIQKEPKEGEAEVSVILLTHTVKEKVMNQAIATIEALTEISGKITKIRVDHLND